MFFSYSNTNSYDPKILIIEKIDFKKILRNYFLIQLFSFIIST